MTLGRKLVRCLIPSAALAAAAVGCNGDEDESPSETILLGFMVLEEDVAQSQGDTARLLVAFREINDQGGIEIDGTRYSLDLVTADHGGAPEGGMAAMETFVEQGVLAVIGPPWSSLTLGESGDGSDGAVAAAQEHGIVLVSGSATAPAITDLDDDDLMWRTVPSDAFRFRETFEALGGTVTGDVSYDVSAGDLDALMTRDYREELDQVFAGSPEAVYLLNFDEFLSITSTIATGGYFDAYAEGEPLIYVSDSVFDENTLVNVAPQVLSRLRGTSQIPEEGNENFQLFSDLMVAEDLGEPEIYDAARYDAVFLVALAIQQAGSLDSDQIAAELRDVSRANSGDREIGVGDWQTAREAIMAGQGVNYEGAAGSIEFSSQGDATSASYVVWSVSDSSGYFAFEFDKTITYNASE
jgi:branched-chain amino acid transport system substrate-binding protein